METKPVLENLLLTIEPTKLRTFVPGADDKCLVYNGRTRFMVKIGDQFYKVAIGPKSYIWVPYANKKNGVNRNHTLQAAERNSITEAMNFLDNGCITSYAMYEVIYDDEVEVSPETEAILRVLQKDVRKGLRGIETPRNALEIVNGKLKELLKN